MASIKSQMTLNDGMSSVLKKITAALDTTLNAFEQVQMASGNAVDVANIEAARAALVEANREVDDMAEGYRQAKEQEDKLNSSINAGTSAMDGMLKKVTSMVAAYMSLSKVKGWVTDSLSAADTQIDAQIQLRTVMGNMGTLDYYDDVLTKASEIQGKGIYGDEAMIAGAAELSTYFSDGQAILSMMDTLSNYAMGMSGGGELDPTAMVDYATGIGKIMSGSYDAMTKKGFEFSDNQKAIIEGTATQAQIVEELGAEYLGLSHDMQAAAVIGSVIDEGWAGLYETMSSTPRAQLISLNNTLGDIKETVGAGIYPAILNFASVVSTYFPQIQSAANGFAAAIGWIITMLTGALELALSFGSFVSDNWSILEPIVWGLVGALIAYNAVSLITNALNAAHATSMAVKAAAEMMSTGATFAATAAQYGLNAALMACPVTWIVVAVLALVVAIVALCNWIAKTTGVAATGFGVITGGINVAIQAVKNAALVVANVALGIWNALGAVCSNIGTAFHNVIANVQGWFYGLLSTALTVVAGICEALNKLPFVEFDYSGIINKADEYAAKSAEAYGSKEEYTSVADAFSEGFNTFDTFTDGWASEAFQAGAAWGDGIADKVGGLFSFDTGSLEDYTGDYNTGLGYDLNGIADDTGSIADSTGGIADSLDVSNEQLEYLRDIAERDAINRFTTAEVKIDMTGMTTQSRWALENSGPSGFVVCIFPLFPLCYSSSVPLIKSSIRAALSCLMLSVRWPYLSRVKAAVACPKLHWMVFISSPARMAFTV